MSADRANVDAAKIATERTKAEVELSKGSALVVGVGPRLSREAETQLFALRSKRTPVHRLDPGLSSSTVRTADLPPALFCLVFGRVEDYMLKGLDLAARALGTVAKKAAHRYQQEITMLVRGVPDGEWRSVMDALKRDADPKLQIRVRPFSADPEDLETDLLQSSLVLVPSRSEGFGLVGIEAIAAGVPLLISDRSGLAELLTEQNLSEYVVVPTTGQIDKDAPAWEAAIDLVLVDRDKAFRRAADIRNQLATVCSWHKAAEKFVQALADLPTG